MSAKAYNHVKPAIEDAIKEDPHIDTEDLTNLLAGELEEFNYVPAWRGQELRLQLSDYIHALRQNRYRMYNLAASH